jgi:hypothetical protein
MALLDQCDRLLGPSDRIRKQKVNCPPLNYVPQFFDNEYVTQNRVLPVRLAWDCCKPLNWGEMPCSLDKLIDTPWTSQASFEMDRWLWYCQVEGGS